MKSNYEYVVEELYKKSFKKENMRQSLGENYKYYIIFMVSVILAISSFIIGVFSKHKIGILLFFVFLIVSGCIIYFRFVKKQDKLVFRKKAEHKIKNFNYYLKEYRFTDEMIQKSIERMKEIEMDKKKSVERRNDTIFKWYITLMIGIIAFFGKEIWEILGVKEELQFLVNGTEFSNLSPILMVAVIIALLFIIYFGLIFKSIYDEFIINKTSNEKSIQLALEDVIYYRNEVKLYQTTNITTEKEVLVEESDSWNHIDLNESF